MKAIIYLTAMVVVLSLALATPNIYGADSAEKYTMVTNFDLIGATLTIPKVNQLSWIES